MRLEEHSCVYDCSSLHLSSSKFCLSSFAWGCYLLLLLATRVSQTTALFRHCCGIVNELELSIRKTTKLVRDNMDASYISQQSSSCLLILLMVMGSTSKFQ